MRPVPVPLRSERTSPDVSGFVRAERTGTGTGRNYRLYYEGRDLAGNKASCTAVLSAVPHDQSDK